MKRVLVVDDDEDVRNLVKIWLSDDYIVDSAVDGNDCLKKIKKNKYDIILLDVMMPGPRPAELVPAISKLLPKAMIIYLTAVEMFNLTPEQEKKGYEPVITEAVKGYLVKPIIKEQLIKKINEAINLSKATTPKKISKKDLRKLIP